MSNFSSSSAVASAFEVDASIWRAVAGACVQIPPPNSFVYYFPQGHLEHCSFSTAFINSFNFALGRPFIYCQVLSIRFFSNHLSDQVFVKITLQPIHTYGPCPVDNAGGDRENNQGDVVLFSKILTPSDANNGGGFSVPRSCAEMIFPPLDFAADPPVQNLTLKDTNNNAWEFRHIYRGTPRRHLLTTGWSKFVNAKRLVAGDSAVFMRKNSTDELYIGVRRAQRFGGIEGQNGGEALRAIENAVKGMAFEVLYCPTFGSPDFVVKAEKVCEATRTNWTAGMRVKMAVEADDSSRLTWSSGTIAAVSCPNTGPWCGSPWGLLQMTWDEPESMRNVNRVSPWQVEYLDPTLMLNPNFPPLKKLKLMSYSDMLLAAGEGDIRFPMAEFNSPLFNASIQGARLDPIYIPTTTTTTNNGDKSSQVSKEIPDKNEGEPERETVSTVLSIGSSYSDKDNVSPPSQSSVASATKLVRENSFQLFGQIIQMPQPGEDGACYSNAVCEENAVIDHQLPSPSALVQKQQQRFRRPSDKS
ncbi:hypothetical protein ABFS83_14G315800 [Erythranthe nasuta]